LLRGGIHLSPFKSNLAVHRKLLRVRHLATNDDASLAAGAYVIVGTTAASAIASCRVADDFASAPEERCRLSETSLVFGDFEMNLDSRELLRRGVSVPIRPKLSGLLMYLILNRDRVVTKNELRENVWPGVSVSDEALTSALRDLRRILGDSTAPHRTIVTIRARGYRFMPAIAARADSIEPVDAQRAARSCLVDRDEVMQCLRESLGDSIEGRFRISLLAGPAGIGKTRAALELAREARCRDIEVHLARS
jgi:DNA-binding winged helix-turn-helix (wHTH) protein